MHNFLERPDVAEVFRRLGLAYAVGGAVRDQALGRDPSDVDFATPILPGEVSALLGGAPIGKFGNVRFNGFDITTFRRDIYSKSRFPKVEFVSTMEEDSLRRDFTMNAMYMDADGRLYDPAGGMADIKARVVRFVRMPAESVAQDRLRALRYFRFCAEIFPDNIDGRAWIACLPFADARGKKFEAERERIRAAAGYAKLRKRGLKL
jgi:tRNA nucleotidyltransferase/poly(A) polymerase